LGISWIYGGQRTEWDFHHWSYSFDSLKEKLEKNGFVNVERLRDQDDWLKVMAFCKKEEDNPETDDRLGRKPLKVRFKGNHYHIFGGGENMTCGLIKILNELYSKLEVEIDLTKIDTKKGFDIDLSNINPPSNRKNDLFICVSHFSLPEPIGKKNIAVIFYPQFDWSREIKGYDKVVAISQYSADAIVDKWKIEPVVISPPVDISKFIVGNKKNQIINVGRFFWRQGGNNKNQHILVKAFSQIPKGWKLVLVGSIQDKQYYDTVRKMAKGLNVEFYHDISFDELVNLYAESEVYWSATGYEAELMSGQEHFGIVAVEALASGCRTLVFNGGGMAEINGVEKWETIDELVNKTLTEPANPEALVAGVERYSFKSIKEQWKNMVEELWK
jgi:glycosyltransferase involved in cell wall biosynthesis